MAAANRNAGFTIAELITVAAIVTVLSAIALPVARFGLRRQKEIELRGRLRRITDAIDQYHDLRIKGVVKKVTSVGETTYPRKLGDLTQPVELIDGKKMRFLRERDLIDPMTGKSEWRTVSSTDDPDAASSNDDDVFDIHSTVHTLSLDGKTYYDQW